MNKSAEYAFSLLWDKGLNLSRFGSFAVCLFL